METRTVVLIVLCLIFLGIILYFVLRPVAITTTTIKNGPLSLSSKTNALSTSDFSSATIANAFYKDGNGTFQCFVFMDALARTGSHVDCGLGTNTPNCDSGLYSTCVCSSTSDCTNCSHAGYQSVFTIHGIYTLEVMNVPDASRPNAIAAQFTVKTATDNRGVAASQIETINLPPINHQKWVMITVSKEGRRIDIFYDNTMVSSTNLQNIPSSITNGTPLITGNSMLSGQIGGLTFLPNRQTIQDVSEKYAKETNTKGDPVIFKTTSTAYSYSVESKKPTTIITSLCLDGSCLNFPQLGQPDVSSYPNIFNTKTSVVGVPFRTQYA